MRASDYWCAPDYGTDGAPFGWWIKPSEAELDYDANVEIRRVTAEAARRDDRQLVLFEDTA